MRGECAQLNIREEKKNNNLGCVGMLYGRNNRNTYGESRITSEQVEYILEGIELYWETVYNRIAGKNIKV